MISFHMAPIYTPYRYLLLLVDFLIIVSFVILKLRDKTLLVRLTIPVALYCFILIISTLTVSKGDFSKSVFESLQYASSILLFFCFNKDTLSNNKVIYTIFGILTALILSNFIFFLIHPKGIVSGGSIYYLFDLQNDTPNYIFVYGFFVAIIGTKHDKLLIPSFIIYNACVIQVLFYDYSTGKVGAILLALLSFFMVFDKDIILKKIPTVVYALIPSLLFLLICVFRFQNLFEGFIVNVLHEDLTFHSRTYAWDYALKAIYKSPFIGYGYTKAKYGYSIIKELSLQFGHSHSEYFETMLHTGLIGFIAFSTPFTLLFRRDNRIRMKKDLTLRTFILCVFAFLIMAIDETVFCQPFIIFLGAGIYYSVNISTTPLPVDEKKPKKEKQHKGKVINEQA